MNKNLKISKKAYKLFKCSGMTTNDILKKLKLSINQYEELIDLYYDKMEFDKDIDDMTCIMTVNENGQIAITEYEFRLKPLVISIIALIISSISILVTVLLAIIV